MVPLDPSQPTPHGCPGPVSVWDPTGRAGPTDEHGHQQPGDSLLLHLLDLGLVPGRHGLAHDGERVGVRDGAHRGRGEPGQPKEREEAAHGHDEQEVEVEARALLQHPLLLADDQPGHKGGLLAWLSTARHGTAWQGSAQHSVAQHYTGCYGSTRHGTAWQGSAWQFGTAQHSMAQFGMAQHRLSQLSKAWHGLAWNSSA